MIHKKIYITEKDKARIQQMMLYCDLFSEQDQKILRKLNYDVSHGQVVLEDDMPQDVVGIHSEVELKEIIWNIGFTITLVFPEDVDKGENRISVLTSIGMSLLGARTGDLVECREPFAVKFVIKNTIQPQTDIRYRSNK
jgi:regulator of nucleoside diphosphate kinase